MTLPEISILTGAILVIMQTGLMLSVGVHRATSKINVGIGNDINLERKVRRHANLAENSALFLIALALAEISGATSLYLIILAAVFVIARVCHAAAFTSLSGSHSLTGPLYPALRAAGAFGTVGSAFGVAVLLVQKAFVG